MAFSFYSTVYATKIASDKAMQIVADNLVAIRNGESVRFYGNTVIRFREYILYTHEVIINFTYKDGIKKIQKAVIPNAITLIDKNNRKDIMIADQAHYSIDTKTLEIKGNVRLQKGNSLIILNELVLHIDEK